MHWGKKKAKAKSEQKIENNYKVLAILKEFTPASPFNKHKIMIILSLKVKRYIARNLV